MSMNPERRDWRPWLKANHGLRMDANSDAWAPDRRELHLSRYRFAAQRCAGQDVLDAACGTGYGSRLLAGQAASVVGVDISADAVEYARAVYASPNTRYVQAPVECTPLANAAFSTIVSFETLEHTLAPVATLREFARLLRADGQLIVSTPNGWGYTKDHFFDIDQDLFEALLGASFDRWELYYNNSGSRRGYSRQAGIGPLAALREGRAECLIAVCSGPLPAGDDDSRHTQWMLEVYRNAMWRHRQFQKAEKRFRSWPLNLLARHWGWQGRTPEARG